MSFASLIRYSSTISVYIGRGKLLNSKIALMEMTTDFD